MKAGSAHCWRVQMRLRRAVGSLRLSPPGSTGRPLLLRVLLPLSTLRLILRVLL